MILDEGHVSSFFDFLFSMQILSLAWPLFVTNKADRHRSRARVSISHGSFE